MKLKKGIARIIIQDDNGNPVLAESTVVGNFRKDDVFEGCLFDSEGRVEGTVTWSREEALDLVTAWKDV